MTKAKIPEFKTLEELAEYWDTHSFADYIDDTEPVEMEVRLEKHRMVLDIDEDLSDKVVEIARKKKQSCKKLVNSWIREKIMQEGTA